MPLNSSATYSLKTKLFVSFSFLIGLGYTCAEDDIHIVNSSEEHWYSSGPTLDHTKDQKTVQQG